MSRFIPLFAGLLSFGICLQSVAQDSELRPDLRPLSLRPVGKADVSRVASASSARSRIFDVELTADRSLTGSVVDRQGRPLAGSLVRLRLGRRVFGETKTGTRGEFHFARVRSGVYEIASKNYRKIIRVWSWRTAPKSAGRGVLLVERSSSTVVRGQTPVPLAGAVGGGFVEAGLLIGATVGVGAVAVNATDSTQPAPPPTAEASAALGPSTAFSADLFGDDGGIGIGIDRGALSPN